MKFDEVVLDSDIRVCLNSLGSMQFVVVLLSRTITKIEAILMCGALRAFIIYFFFCVVLTTRPFS